MMKFRFTLVSLLLLVFCMASGAFAEEAKTEDANSVKWPWSKVSGEVSWQNDSKYDVILARKEWGSVKWDKTTDPFLQVGKKTYGNYRVKKGGCPGNNIQITLKVTGEGTQSATPIVVKYCDSNISSSALVNEFIRIHVDKLGQNTWSGYILNK